MKLYTNDLLLKTVDNDDIDEVARMWRFERGAISKEEAKLAIDDMQCNHKKNKIGHIYHLCFAVFQKQKSSIIGWCGLDGTSAGKLHIFYSIAPVFRNRGYATQCAERLLSYAFNEAMVPFVNGGCYKDNIASYQVMKKTGMIQNSFEENGDPLFYMDVETYRTKRIQSS